VGEAAQNSGLNRGLIWHTSAFNVDLLNCTPIRVSKVETYGEKRLEQRPHYRPRAAIEIAIEEKAGRESAPLSEPTQ
jgi:hypothetical protein